MATTKTKYLRRKRHRENAKLRNKKSVRKHQRIGGRTGMVWKKQTRSQKQDRIKIVIPNKPMAKPLGVASLNVTRPLETEGRTAIQRIAVADEAMPPKDKLTDRRENNQ